jgi:hypothetical protein
VLRAAGISRIGDNVPVRDGGVSPIHYHGNVESGFETRLIEAGETAARTCRLELRDGILAPVGFDTIKSAQLVIQSTREVDVKLGVTGAIRLSTAKSPFPAWDQVLCGRSESCFLP